MTSIAKVEIIRNSICCMFSERKEKRFLGDIILSSTPALCMYNFDFNL